MLSGKVLSLFPAGIYGGTSISPSVVMLSNLNNSISSFLLMSSPDKSTPIVFSVTKAGLYVKGAFGVGNRYESCAIG